jgi:RNA polymerase sigma-70 factor (ECF subfamily)
MVVADAVLVERALAGDLEGFGELHRRYYQRVVNVVFGIVKDRGQAEDMVQDAYVSALKELPRLVDPGRFYPWLCRIAVNRAIEEKRKESRRGKYHGDMGPDGAEERKAVSGDPNVLEEMVKSEQSSTVKAALHHLPEGQRAAVVLRFFDGLPMKNIAQVLGCEEVTARTQIFRGVRRLGVLLKQMDPKRTVRP